MKAMDWGKWPHEVMLNSNDEPGPFDTSLAVFDHQCREFYLEAVKAQNRKRR